MTQPVYGSTNREKVWSDDQDELACTSDDAARSTESPNTSLGSCGSNLDCLLDELHRQNGSQNFGVLAKPTDERGQDNGLAGARGAGSGPALPEGALPPRTPSPTRRGPAIAVGVQASAAAGGGPGLSAGIEVGLMLDGTGLSLYSTSTKVPTHCQDQSGAPASCSEGVGAAAGFGVTGHLILDADAAEGEGRAASMDLPAGSFGISYLPDDKVTSIDFGVGPSAGAAAHADHVVTDYSEVLLGGP